MKFAKLFEASGKPLHEPVALSGSVSFDARTGEAHAWAEDGVTMLGTMVKARVVWIGATGMRLEGMEPFDGPKTTHFRAMEWHFSW